MSENKYCILRFSKIKTFAEFNGRLRHNLRYGKEKGKFKYLSNPQKANIISGIYNEGVNSHRILEKRLGKDYKYRKNNVLGTEFIFTYSKNAIPDERVLEWASASMRWLEGVFTEQNIVSAVIHRDEESIHIHAVAVPVAPDDKTKKPKLRFKKFIDGPTACRELQDSYAKLMNEHSQSDAAQKQNEFIKEMFAP